MEIVQGEATHVVDIAGVNKRLLAKMEDRISNSLLGHRETVTNKNCCIFRLPTRLKNMNGKSLEPQVVALGPYHHGKPQLQIIEELKWRCLTTFMEDRKGKLEECLARFRLLEKKVRESYSETINLSTDDLLQMMVVDGCFIFVLFICFGIDLDLPRNYYKTLCELDSVILSKIFGDVLLLENQIPSFVLMVLYKVCFDCDKSLFDIAAGFLCSLKVIPYSKKMSDPPEWLHLLDLYRSTFISHGHNIGKRRIYVRPKPFSPIPCVTKLRLAGIKVNQHMSDTFLDVKFKNGVIEMPDINLNDSMCSLLVNCVALEQLCNISKHFSIYAMLLDCLVNTAKDIDYLCDRRIIDNFLGTDAEAAQFINNLGNDLSIYKDRGDDNNYFLLDVFVDVNEYYQKRLNWGKWTSFKREYFGKPWLLISAFAGFVLLVLAFLQTYYTIYAYKHPKN